MQWNILQKQYKLMRCGTVEYDAMHRNIMRYTMLYVLQRIRREMTQCKAIQWCYSLILFQLHQLLYIHVFFLKCFKCLWSHITYRIIRDALCISLVLFSPWTTLSFRFTAHQLALYVFLMKYVNCRHFTEMVSKLWLTFFAVVTRAGLPFHVSSLILGCKEENNQSVIYR